MRTTLIICVLGLLTGCKNKADNRAQAGQRTNTDIANDFIDAFYSFNRDSLQVILTDAPAAQPEILYYQKWAECAHYQVLNRAHYFEKNDSTVLFPVTVKDDLMAALQIDFNVTDTFHITIQNKRITQVATSSNDPEVYHQAKEWVNQNRPDLVKKACEGIWQGGPTPCECAQGVLKGFSEFVRDKELSRRKKS
ncbi:MAG: hypothetical protein ACKOE6_03935 [Flammeovirgaceae bacterium]